MSITEIIESGILEAYVIGEISDIDLANVEEAMKNEPLIKNEIKRIELALEKYARANAIESDPTALAMLFAKKNFAERIAKGELLIAVPTLSSASKIADYKSWIERLDLQAPNEYGSMHGKIIGSDEEKTTMIIWLKDGAPDETHTDEYEKFLIVEGTCNIIIGNKVNSLKAGDFIEIPLYVTHRVEVTSLIPCKIILERAAA